MNLIRFTTISLILFFAFTQNIFAENHETKKNIVEQSKDLNKEIVGKQTVTQENIASEIDEEEIPLNDPFAGDVGTSTSNTTGFLSDNTEEMGNEKSLYNYKLVGVISGLYESYISLVNNRSGDIISLVIHEELNEGLKLVDMRLDEAIFKKSDGAYISINFKNQIIEKNVY